MKFTSPLRSVRGRLILVAVLIEALMLTILVANSLRLLTTHMGTQARNHAEQISPVLIAAITAPLAQRDYATVQAVLDESRAVKGIDYLVLTDTGGRRIAASGWPENKALPQPDRQFALFDSKEESPRHDVMVPIVTYGQPMGALHFGLDLSQIRAAHGDLFNQGVLIALLEIILSAGLMSLLGYFLTRHLSALTRASQAVAARAGRIAQQVQLGQRGGRAVVGRSVARRPVPRPRWAAARWPRPRPALPDTRVTRSAS